MTSHNEGTYSDDKYTIASTIASTIAGTAVQQQPLQASFRELSTNMHEICTNQIGEEVG